jgi:pimeloyl-ACP methyl ester carboxylesterase
VEIRGTFYPSAATQAPVALLIHNLKGNRHKDGWEKLARALQDQQFAVLTFDLRGHGDSTTVGAAFWRVPENQRLVRARRTANGQLPTKISYKDYIKHPAYYPMLVNDVAAAKSFLNQQNNANLCNSHSVFVIGAEDGAALGAAWIAYEWSRRPVQLNALGVAVPNLNADPPGKDIMAAVWLTIPERLPGSPVRVVRWLRAVRREVPMAFVYGEKDRRGAQAAKVLFREVEQGSKSKLKLTAKLAKNTNQNGVNLLGKQSLNTEENITKYLQNVLDEKVANGWTKQPEEPPFLITTINLERAAVERSRGGE